MIQYKKILMTLALLLTAATGAWADGDTKYTLTFKANGNTKTVENVTLPKTFSCNVDDETGRGTDELDVIIQELYGLSGNYCLNTAPNSDNASVTCGMDDADLQYIIVNAPFNGTATVTGKYIDTNYSVFDYSLEITLAEAPIEVTTDAAEEGATFTEATFAMPAFDATAEYELVRDMGVSMTTKIGDGNNGYRIRIKKDNQTGKFVPAEMNPQAMAGLITVTDDIEEKTLTNVTDYTVSIFAVDGDNNPTGDAIAFTDLVPGRYVAIATAADGSAYDGATEQSNVFVLYQGFPVVVPATEGEVGETVDLGTVSFYTNEFNLKLDPANQAKLYTLTAIDGSTVTATQVDVVPAGMPFFVLNEDDVEQMVTLIPADDNELPTTSPLVIAEFLGATEDLTFTQDDMDGAYNYYVLYKGAFVWVKDPGTLKAGKCYLRVPKNQPTTSRRIVFGDATAVYDLNDKSEMINDNYYDLNGRKVNAPKKKGVYIQNGRKVVVK